MQILIYAVLLVNIVVAFAYGTMRPADPITWAGIVVAAIVAWFVVGQTEGEEKAEQHAEMCRKYPSCRKFKKDDLPKWSWATRIFMWTIVFLMGLVMTGVLFPDW